MNDGHKKAWAGRAGFAFRLRRARESYHCMIHRSIQNRFFDFGWTGAGYGIPRSSKHNSRLQHCCGSTLLGFGARGRRNGVVFDRISHPLGPTPSTCCAMVCSPNLARGLVHTESVVHLVRDESSRLPSFPPSFMVQTTRHGRIPSGVVLHDNMHVEMPIIKEGYPLRVRSGQVFL
ncbi:hypothetical protein VTJ49DRAFT_2064 [Mycothermus thermophilus]|uniref:Uncharacterized protein n=1 Tax=Humicola insolens TaxID=85995 RepID=A0ABR3VB41_HUMIN